MLLYTSALHYVIAPLEPTLWNLQLWLLISVQTTNEIYIEYLSNYTMYNGRFTISNIGRV